MENTQLDRVGLLEALRKRTEEVTRNLRFPVRRQTAEDKETEAPPTVYVARLPDFKRNSKKAPYVLHQAVKGEFRQEPGERPEGRAVIRSIFCVYAEDEQEGGLLLLNLMERIRIDLSRNPLLGPGGQYWLDMESGLEDIQYPDDTHPYYMGEMVSTWRLPMVEREAPGLRV